MTLREIYIADLNHLVAAARQKLMEWPILAARTQSPLLRATFDNHYAETRAHLLALERLFERLDERPRPSRLDALNAVLDLWRNRQRDTTSGDAREVALISTGLAVDYHTLPIYADALTAARGLGDHDGSGTLQTLLKAERDRTHRLSAFHDWLANQLGGSDKKNSEGPIVKADVPWPSEAPVVRSVAATTQPGLESAFTPSAATRRG